MDRIEFRLSQWMKMVCASCPSLAHLKRGMPAAESQLDQGQTQERVLGLTHSDNKIQLVQHYAPVK